MQNTYRIYSAISAVNCLNIPQYNGSNNCYCNEYSGIRKCFELNEHLFQTTLAKEYFICGLALTHLLLLTVHRLFTKTPNKNNKNILSLI